jgi:thioredoxin reductase (NADPH)
MKNLIISFLLIFSFSNLISEDLKPATCKEKEYCVAILGGGVGALTSGIYLSRAGYHPIIIEGSLPGGLITQSHSVENWPGEMKISGMELMDKIRDQAEANGCVIISKEVISVDFSKNPFTIKIKDLYRKDEIEEIKARGCIIAMGTSSKYINVPGEKTYWGKGISNCAVCDGSLYRDKTVAVVGGGDAAIIEASYLSNIAKKVVIVIRSDKLKVTEQQRLEELKKLKNIEFLYNTNIVQILGDKENVSTLVLKNDKKTYKLEVEGVFLAVGSTPNTRIFKDKLALDDKGYIKVEKNQNTSIDGVFALGDIVNPEYKQAITAAGDGAKAAMSVQKYLEKYSLSKNQKLDNRFSYSQSVVSVNDAKQFDEEINSCDMPIIIDFYASWCRPCQRIAPFIEQIGAKLKGKVKLVKVNVEKLRDIAQKYKVSAMPTIVVLDKNKNFLFKEVGPGSISDLLTSLEKMNNKSPDEINNYLKKLK